MTRTVILRHVLPDATSHFDWLIARDAAPGPPDARTLIAFRLSVLPWSPAAFPTFTATRLPDHRVLYLTHEGPLPPSPDAPALDRGSITRVSVGDAAILAGGPPGEPLHVAIRFPEGQRRLRGHPGPPAHADRWVFDDLP